MSKETVIEAMKSLGMKEKCARVLEYIMTHPNTTQYDIERATYLRQPEVSRAVKELVSHDWIKTSENIRKGFGHKVHIYKVSKSPLQLAKEIRDLYNDPNKIERSMKTIMHVK